MVRWHHVRAVYLKELVETLRDRRTLVAMIVIPVLLYPLMLLGMVYLHRTERARLVAETYRIAAADEPTRRWIEHMLALGEVLYPPMQEVPAPPEVHPRGVVEFESPVASDVVEPPRFDVIVTDVADEAIGADTPEAFHLKVAVEATVPAPDAGGRSPVPFADLRLRVHVVYRQANVRSQSAYDLLVDLLRRYDRYAREQAIRALAPLVRTARPGTDLAGIVHPVSVEWRDVSTAAQRGGQLLAMVIPIVLVILTVNGAVYPAIDLTAGERERGTLETLLVAPIRPGDVITGKFLVIATIAMVTAILNVGSMAATVYFGGIGETFAGAAMVQIPMRALPMVLVCLVPFAVLAAAIMLAVCSCARSFKEAQNYAVPVLIATMLPASVGLQPSVRLEGMWLITPVANLTLITRDLLLETASWQQVVQVVLATAVYAAAAVGLAARLFAQEAVVFAETLSLPALLSRRRLAPRTYLTAGEVLVLLALIFPLNIYTQMAVTRRWGGEPVAWLAGVGANQVAWFALLPLAWCAYFRIDIRQAMNLRAAPLRYWAAATLIGLSAWVLAWEWAVWQSGGRIDRSLEELSGVFAAALEAVPMPVVYLLLAVVPAVCEEMLFRGFLLGGLRSVGGKWTAITLVALLFGVFHVYTFKIVTTAALGFVLAVVAWQAGSIWPAVWAHALHNAILVTVALRQDWLAGWAPEAEETMAHVPAALLIPASLVFAAGVYAVMRHDRTADMAAGESA